jgi:hypothetical protein
MILEEKCNDEDIIGFLSALEDFNESDEEVESNLQKKRTHVTFKPELNVFDDIGEEEEDYSLKQWRKHEPFQLDNGEEPCDTLSLEEEEEISADERLDSCSFSFNSNEESSAAPSSDGSSLTMEFLNKGCSPLDFTDKNTQNNTFCWVSDLFSYHGKTEEDHTSAEDTDVDDFVPEEPWVLSESIVVDDQQIIGTSVVVSPSNQSAHMEQDEQQRAGDEDGRKGSDAFVNNLKYHCAMENDGDFPVEKISFYSPFPGLPCLINDDGRSIISDLASLVANDDDTSIVSVLVLDRSSSKDISVCEEKRQSVECRVSDDLSREGLKQKERLLDSEASFEDEDSSQIAPLGEIQIEDDTDDDYMFSSPSLIDKYIPAKNISHGVVHAVGTNVLEDSNLSPTLKTGRSEDVTPPVEQPHFIGQTRNNLRPETSKGRLYDFVKKKLQERRSYRGQILLALNE